MQADPRENLRGKPARCRAVRRYVRALVIVALYSFGALFALSESVRWPGMVGGKRAEFGDMVYGRAERPFVTRVLVPWVIHAGVTLMPSSAKALVASEDRAAVSSSPELSWIEQYPVEFLLAMVVHFLALVAFAFALRRLCATLLELRGMPCDFAPLLALLTLPCMYAVFSHIYDFTNLLLFTLGLLMLAGRRWNWYLLVFLLATVNKETAILLTLLWALYERRRIPDRRYLARLALQVTVWLAVRAGLAALYNHNTGYLLVWQLPRNIHLLMRPEYLLLFRQIGNFPLVPFGPNVVFLFALLVAVLRSPRTHRLLRDALWIAVPLLSFALLFGHIDETRAYYELFPVVFLILIEGVYSVLGYLTLDRHPPQSVQEHGE
ncbi:MAG: hypothetical protein NTX53_17320 [candidate division WOR-3 bacterium]|nr:hypothetical protein [candidate division WOR-3 bacterium]